MVNVSKHTDSRSVTIKLDYSPPSVRLSIKDKGQGFQVERALSGEGIGLRNMKERIEYIGGEFQVWSKPGEGTVSTSPLTRQRITRDFQSPS
ncbi:histidine kinase, partial [Veronia nyctiphanis]